MPPDRLGVRAIDDYTLEIRLSHAVPYFPDILTNTVASPVHPSSLTADWRLFGTGQNRLERAVCARIIRSRRESPAQAQSALLGFGRGRL